MSPVPPPLTPLIFTSAASLYPSADEATHSQSVSGASLTAQVAPASVEVKMQFVTVTTPETPNATATNLFPSAEEAMENHCLTGALVCLVQLTPAFVEV